jgi:hypothetical protein
MIFYHLRILRRIFAGPKHHSVMTKGRPPAGGCWSMSNAAASAGAAGPLAILRAVQRGVRRRRVRRRCKTFQGLRAGREQRTLPQTPRCYSIQFQNSNPQRQTIEDAVEKKISSADLRICSAPNVISTLASHKKHQLKVIGYTRRVPCRSPCSSLASNPEHRTTA